MAKFSASAVVVSSGLARLLVNGEEFPNAT